MQQSVAATTGVRWTLVVPLSVPAAVLDRRARTCRQVWDALVERAQQLGLDAPGGGVVRTRRGSLVLVCGEAELAGALLDRDAIASVVAYELRERVERHP